MLVKSYVRLAVAPLFLPRPRGQDRCGGGSRGTCLCHESEWSEFRGLIKELVPNMGALADPAILTYLLLIALRKKWANRAITGAARL